MPIRIILSMKKVLIKIKTFPENYFKKNKKKPLLKTQEKDFHFFTYYKNFGHIFLKFAAPKELPIGKLRLFFIYVFRYPPFLAKLFQKISCNSHADTHSPLRYVPPEG